MLASRAFHACRVSRSRAALAARSGNGPENRCHRYYAHQLLRACLCRRGCKASALQRICPRRNPHS